jgi:DNA-directed RNA polymerase subunit L
VDVKITEEGNKSMTIEFVGADRTVAEIIKGELTGNADVEFVAVVKEHSEIDDPKLIIKAVKNPKTLVLKAIDKIEEKLDELRSKIPK